MHKSTENFCINLRAFIVAGAMVGMLWPVQSSAVDCGFLHGMYFTDHGLVRHAKTVQLYVTSSNIGFKGQTNFVFAGNGYPAQNFTKALHRFFNLNIMSLSGSTPVDFFHQPNNYVKFNELVVRTSPEHVDVVGEVVLRAQHATLEDMAEMLFDGRQKHVDALRDVLSVSDIQGIQSYVQQKFSSKERFVEYLEGDYGVGVDKSLVGSHFMTKYTGLFPATEARHVFFDAETFRLHIDELLVKKSELAWLFTALDPIDIFSLVRAHQDKPSPKDWAPAFQALLAKRFQGQKQIDPLDYALAYEEVMNYVDHLNVLDYLPREAIAGDRTAVGQFVQCDNPTGFVYVDIRKVGAKGMLQMHKSLETLQAQAAAVQAEKARVAQLASPTLQDLQSLRLRLQDLQKTRREILREASDEVDTVFENVLRTFEAQNIKLHDLVYWRAGDDLVVMFRSQRHDAVQMAGELKANPYIRSRVRVGAENLHGQTQGLSVETIRLRAGLASAPLKILEGLELEGEVLVQMRSDRNTPLTLFEVDQRGQVTPLRADLSNLVLETLARETSPY